MHANATPAVSAEIQTIVDALSPCAKVTVGRDGIVEARQNSQSRRLRINVAQGLVEVVSAQGAAVEGVGRPKADVADLLDAAAWLGQKHRILRGMTMSLRLRATDYSERIAPARDKCPDMGTGGEGRKPVVAQRAPQPGAVKERDWRERVANSFNAQMRHAITFIEARKQVTTREVMDELGLDSTRAAERVLRSVEKHAQGAVVPVDDGTGSLVWQFWRPWGFTPRPTPAARPRQNLAVEGLSWQAQRRRDRIFSFEKPPAWFTRLQPLYGQISQWPSTREWAKERASEVVWVPRVDEASIIDANGRPKKLRCGETRQRQPAPVRLILGLWGLGLGVRPIGDVLNVSKTLISRRIVEARRSTALRDRTTIAALVAELPVAFATHGGVRIVEWRGGDLEWRF